MSNDKTTLADVQPGGRVRLGDQAELDRLEFQAWARELLPCPFCGNGAEFVPYKDNGLTLKCKSMGCIQRNQRTLRYGIDWLRTSMAEHWNTRALSAQPSPGGQDVLFIEELAELRRLVPSVNQKHALDAAIAALAARQPVVVDLPESLHDRVEALRDLAARQPVGEPVAWMTHHDEPMLFPTAAEAAEYCEDDEQPVPLFRSPAQAVDLGHLPRYEPIGSDGMNMERIADGRWVKLDDVLALIDSQAAGGQP